MLRLAGAEFCIDRWVGNRLFSVIMLDSHSGGPCTCPLCNCWHLLSQAACLHSVLSDDVRLAVAPCAACCGLSASSQGDVDVCWVLPVAQGFWL
jgi:hypothetical protein